MCGCWIQLLFYIMSELDNLVVVTFCLLSNTKQYHSGMGSLLQMSLTFETGTGWHISRIFIRKRSWLSTLGSHKPYITRTRTILVNKNQI